MGKGLAQRYTYDNFERDREIDEFKFTLPEPPPKKEIDGYGLKPENQLFTPPTKKQMGEISYKMDNGDKLSKEDNEFIDLQWERRELGYWFYNNGNLEYITGLHYYYLTAWNIIRKESTIRRDGSIGSRKISGLPTFTDSDRDYFYIWNETTEDDNCFGLIHITNRRDGKALDLKTKIPTPNGWTTMGDLKEGDYVFDSKGKPTLVTYATEIQYDRDCYKVSLSDGSSIIADKDHQWIAKNKTSRANINHKTWKSHNRVVSTEDMLNTLKVGKKGREESNWSIETCKPVEYNTNKFEIPPYILGLWLGDGTSCRAEITSIDKSIVDSWTAYTHHLGMEIRQTKKSITYNSVRATDSKGENVFRRKLRDCNVLNNKHIPESYLQSSIEHRIELLQGLMDTDGCVTSNKRGFEYCSKSIELITGVKELIDSLGFKSTLTSKFNKRYKKSYYYVRFGFQGDIIPFKLKRKIDLIQTERKGGWRTNHRYVTNIEPVNSVPVRCITVDSEDSSYLCGENFVVTHNTYRATATLNELISRSPDSIGGIQSKTDTDGGKVFKKLVKSWQRLPEYFKPVDVGDSDPSKKIEYRNPKKRSTKTQKKEYSQVLGSEINYGNSKETFYDGDGLAIILHDEIGKTESADVWERWDIVKECLADGADVTGKAILTTTVEEMEKKGGANCKKIWDESDSESDTFKAAKQTISGLKRYFKPAYYGLRGADKTDDGDETPTFIDEYGYSDIEAAERYLIKVEKTLTGEKLISRKRKYPRDIKDAFMVSGKTESLPVAKIYEQKEFNESLPPSVVTRGNFVWEDMNQHIVKFYEDPKGFFEISWMPEAEQRCQHSYDSRGYPKPSNTILGNIGVDPFDHKVTVATKKSNAAAQLFRRFNIDSPMNSNGFVFNYVGRRDDPDDFYEDMIMAGVFYGVKVFSENQKPGLNNHMTRRGYQNYIKKTKQSDYTKSTSKTSVEGVSMAGKLVRDQSINGLVTYIYKFIGKISIEVQMEEFGWKREDCKDDLYGNCPFESLLDDWLKFDANDWTVSDETVSSMISILGVTPIRKNKNDGKEREVKIDLSKLFQSQRTKF